MRLTRSMTLLRRTSLGWAVITGMTRAWSRRARTAAASTPSPASRPIAPASERSAPVAGAQAPARALILGDVDELREAHEAVGEAQGVRQRKPLQQPVEPRGALGRALAVVGHRGLADRLDGAEHVLALLLGQHPAENVAEQADIGAQAHGGRRGVGHRAALEPAATRTASGRAQAASCRSTAASTRAGASSFRHLKWPSGQTRSKHGLHGTFSLKIKARSLSGGVKAGEVEP